MIYGLVDFGSTFTKLALVDGGTGALLGTSQHPTTIDTDVFEGYDAALSAALESAGVSGVDRVLAASSAAGGLRMIAVGLVDDLTASADAGPGTCKYADNSALTTSGNRIANSMLCITNNERRAAGLAPLTNNTKLTNAAVAHSRDMAQRNYDTHNTPEGGTPDQRLTQAGYVFSWWGENIANGYKTPRQVMAAWMASPGHRANILNPNFKEIGIGLWYTSSKVVRYTQDFGQSPNGQEGTVTGLEPQFQK